MARYKITLELDTTIPGCYLQDRLKNLVKQDFDNVKINGVEKVSLTPEEAIQQIKNHISSEQCSYDHVRIADLMEILNKVQ